MNITPINVTGGNEWMSDRELMALDEEQFRQESRGELVHRIANEMVEKRLANLSTEDFILALEILSTKPDLMEKFKNRMLNPTGYDMHWLKGMVTTSLTIDSIQEASSQV